ncbi:hypothetical protein [Litoreibacter roseus]|uniref:Uncharacterized protein n=1 Tax=Litoreibacter roseus TaxID=2601869 RepID=A0A6N6JME1_9RHOB|nr:hypothetical protein [Litoreibacter roseus]GFE67275.1 hypothetical protein KIN_43490 [Litoreibacter roseus]
MIFLLWTTSLVACTQYTDATSPCLGEGTGSPREGANTAILPFVAPPTKDCMFEEIGLIP